MSDRFWWQNEYLVDDIQVTLAHINSARQRQRFAASWPGWELDACKDLFDALNRLWTTLRNTSHGGDLTDASESKCLTSLLKTLGESDRSALLALPSVADFADLEPVILDHGVAGVTQRLEDIQPETSEEASQAHRHFKANWAHWHSHGSRASKVLGDLARGVLVVRNNLMHGEKTRVGPDRERSGRNRQVTSVVAPVLAEMLDFLLDRPSQKFAAYGTVRPGGPNHSIVSGLHGEWAPVRLNGLVEDSDGLPSFRFDASCWAEADMLTSPDLREKWDALDRFEGNRYMRHLGIVWHDDVPLVGNVYVGTAHETIR